MELMQKISGIVTRMERVLNRLYIIDSVRARTSDNQITRLTCDGPLNIIITGSRRREVFRGDTMEYLIS